MGNEQERLSARVEAEDEASSVLRGFVESLRGVPAGLQAVAAGVAVAAGGLAAATTIVVSAAQAFAQHTDQLEKNSAALGTNVEALHAYERAADSVGSNLDELTRASLRINTILQQNKDKYNDVRKELLEYGIDARTAADATPLQQLDMVAQALRNIEDPATRSRAAVRLLGQDLATSLGPALMDTERQWSALVVSMRAKGSVFDEVTVQRVDRARERVRQFRSELRGLGEEMLAGILEGIDKDRPRIPANWYLFLRDLDEFRKKSRDALAGAYSEPPAPAPAETQWTIDEYVKVLKDGETDARNSIRRTKEEWNAYFDNIERRADRLTIRGARPFVEPSLNPTAPGSNAEIVPGAPSDNVRQSLGQIFADAGGLMEGMRRVNRVLLRENAAYVRQLATDMLNFTKYVTELTLREWSQSLVAGERWAASFEEVQKRLLQRLAAFALETWVRFLGRLALEGVFSALTKIGIGIASAGVGSGSAELGTSIGGGVVAMRTAPVRNRVTAPLELNATVHTVYGSRIELQEAGRVLGIGLREAGVVR